MPAIEMIDTNILVYAYDKSQGHKQHRVAEILTGLWETRSGIISIQVLQEFYVIITSKVTYPIFPDKARKILELYSAWPVVSPTTQDVINATLLAERYEISFWDAMILTAAESGGASILWSEDLNPGQKYKTIEIRNPFTEIPGE